MTAAERAPTLEALKPYPTYKDSGAGWIGDIPSSWNVQPVRRSFSVIGGTTPDSGAAEFWDGDLLWATPEDLSKVKQKRFGDTRRKLTPSGVESTGLTTIPADTLLMTTRAPIGNLGITGVPMTFNQGCKALLPMSGMDVDYAYYAFMAAVPLLQAAGKGTTFLELSASTLKSFSLPSPPSLEQTTIAAFLDHETARIDALVREQELLLEDLAEKRHAVCFHAVTQGIKPSPEITAIDHPWINLSPAQWRRWKVSRAFGALGSGTTPPTDMGDYYDGDIDWVNTGDLKDKPIHSVPKRVTSDAVRDYPTLRRYPPGTVVMAMYGATIGKLGLLTTGATVNQACCTFVEGGPVLNRFAFYWLLAMRPFIVALGYGGGQPNISQQTIRNMEIIAPDQAQQLEIADFLDERLAQIDALVQEVRANIEDMKLLRSTLITAATTGKIDVRDWRPA